MNPLRDLLDRARNASRADRIDLRNEIAAYGDEAVGGLRTWITDPELSGFAVRVLGRIAEDHSRALAVEALRAARDAASPTQWVDIARELRRLGALVAPSAEPTDYLDDEVIREQLSHAATGRLIVFYSDLAELLGRPMRGQHWAAPIYHALDRISRHEVGADRPMLSAIVIAKDTKLPGAGFFTLARELGLIRMGESDEAAAKRLRGEVFDYWAKARRPELNEPA